ncbi:MAG TPA: ATP-binding protein [Verrucomicrobiota bacterium]|nr:ATP-binding protein [Verrucomicrobiota bacterium]
MQTVLERLIDDFHERALPALTRRDVPSAAVPGKANVVIGMRRAGKTFYCYQQMQSLMAAGIGKERLLYLNFEDERLLPFAAADFQEILDTYYRRFPAFKQQTCHFFLDELQRVEGWDRFVRRVLDTENVRLWLTGSSSKLLSSEIATSLRGRSLTTEVFPFSFREFLRFRGEEPASPLRWGSQTRATLAHHAESYLRLGGFPEVQEMEDELRRHVLQNYLDVVILRDVVERHGFRNLVALRALIRQLLTAPASCFSVSKFYQTLRSQGIACTKNDLYLFLDALADAFLVYPVPIRSRSNKARQVNPRKVYAVDNGLLDAMSFRLTEDRGVLLENLVFVELRRRGLAPEYYFTQSGREVDFVLPDTGEGGIRLIQVCWTLKDAHTRAREEAALREAMKELRLRQGCILTWMEEDTSQPDLTVVPVWKWLVGG